MSNPDDFDFAETATETNPPALKTTTPAGEFDDFDFVDHYAVSYTHLTLPTTPYV